MSAIPFFPQFHRKTKSTLNVNQCALRNVFGCKPDVRLVSWWAQATRKLSVKSVIRMREKRTRRFLCGTLDWALDIGDWRGPKKSITITIELSNRFYECTKRNAGKKCVLCAQIRCRLIILLLFVNSMGPITHYA